MADLTAQPPSGQTDDWITVEITEALGSTPRDAGTCMWVGEAIVTGTIGGGALEHRPSPAPATCSPLTKTARRWSCRWDRR